jgi:hypothetical protein
MRGGEPVNGVSRIPPQLQREDLLFVAIPRGQKGPITPGWNLVQNGLRWDDPYLISHLEAGGNCGFYPAPNSNILLLDIDDAGKFHEAGGHELVEGTFMYSAWPDRHKFRAILKCPDIPAHWRGHKSPLGVVELYFPAGPVTTSSRDEAGIMREFTVLKTGGQCVAPGSVHPNGNIYQAFDEAVHIRAVTWSDVVAVCARIKPAALERAIPNKGPIQGQYQEAPGGRLLRDRYRLCLEMPDSPYPSGNGEIRGVNQFHGSTSAGGNVAVNPRKGVFHCFRHGKGYDAAGCDAIRRGLILCGDNYDLDVFKKHTAALEHDFPEVRRKEKISWVAKQPKTHIQGLLRRMSQ